MTPLELELQVRILLESLGHPLIKFQAKHRERTAGPDGRYEIDVTARFRALNVQFVVLAECKMQSYQTLASVNWTVKKISSYPIR